MAKNMPWQCLSSRKMWFVCSYSAHERGQGRRAECLMPSTGSLRASAVRACRGSQPLTCQNRQARVPAAGEGEEARLLPLQVMLQPRCPTALGATWLLENSLCWLQTKHAPEGFVVLYSAQALAASKQQGQTQQLSANPQPLWRAGAGLQQGGTCLLSDPRHAALWQGKIADKPQTRHHSQHGCQEEPT